MEVMVKQIVTASNKMSKIKNQSTANSAGTPFTVKFGLFLALLTTFVLPVALMSPLIVAKLLGFPLVEHIGMTVENFGVFVLAVQVVGLLISLVIIAKKLKNNGSTWSIVGLKKFKPFQAARYIVGYYLILLSLLVALAIVAAIIIGFDVPATPNNESGGTGILTLMGNFWLTFILVVILAPIIEEIVFRGILFSAIKKRYGLTIGVIGSSLVFTLVHFDPVQMISVLPLGVYLALMYHRTGSIYPGIILHATWNLLVLLIAQSSA
jgi:membrane protease YdiL (CAAX protease family)